MTCRQCGRDGPAEARLCSSCAVLAPLPPVLWQGGRRIALTAAGLVLVVALAGAAIVFAQAGRLRPAAAGDQAPPGSGPAPRASDLASGQLAGGSPAHQAAASPAAARPAAASPAASPAVAMASTAAAAPHAAAVDAFLTRYFSAINRHDYRAYLRLFDPQSRRALSAAGFRAGYGTTRDTQESLTGLTTRGPGQLAAAVTFTSRQDSGSSQEHAGCLHWSITMYLVRLGRRYVIGNPPDGYAATFRRC
jgi:hypothetical protein